MYAPGAPPPRDEPERRARSFGFERTCKRACLLSNLLSGLKTNKRKPTLVVKFGLARHDEEDIFLS